MNIPTKGDIPSPDEKPLEPREIALVQRLLGDPMVYPDKFKNWIPSWIEAHPPDLKSSQMSDFSGFSPKIAYVVTSETRSSTSFGDLATAGPELAGLPDGKYVLIYGARIVNDTSGQAGYMAVKINSTEAVDADAAIHTGTNASSVVSAQTKDLSGGINTLTARYRATGGTATFSSRFLIAIKYSNL